MTGVSDDIASHEQQFEAVLAQRQREGRLGVPQHTAAAQSQHTVSDLPPLQLSGRLAHAASLAQREHANGYSLLGNKKPKNVLTGAQLATLQGVAAHGAR